MDARVVAFLSLMPGALVVAIGDTGKGGRQTIVDGQGSMARRCGTAMISHCRERKKIKKWGREKREVAGGFYLRWSSAGTVLQAAMVILQAQTHAGTSDMATMTMVQARRCPGRDTVWR